MLAVVTLALMSGRLNLDQIIGQQREGLLLPAAASAVVMTAMLALAFAEASVPPDGLDETVSGTTLAVTHMTVWLRRLVWIDLIGGSFLPVGMATIAAGPLSWLIGLVAWGIKLGAFILGLCAIQTTLGRVPHRRLPDLIGVAALLALLAVIMVLAGAGIT
jgi:formate hydrogenlyase subunit 4